MNGLLLLIICCVALLAGYVFYGRYLCKKWGVGENDQATPAHTMPIPQAPDLGVQGQQEVEEALKQEEGIEPAQHS